MRRIRRNLIKIHLFLTSNYLVTRVIVINQKASHPLETDAREQFEEIIFSPNVDFQIYLSFEDASNYFSLNYGEKSDTFLQFKYNIRYR